jgi:hypothetical protein
VRCEVRHAYLTPYLYGSVTPLTRSFKRTPVYLFRSYEYLNSGGARLQVCAPLLPLYDKSAAADCFQPRVSSRDNSLHKKQPVMKESHD